MKTWVRLVSVNIIMKVQIKYMFHKKNQCVSITHYFKNVKVFKEQAPYYLHTEDFFRKLEKHLSKLGPIL